MPVSAVANPNRRQANFADENPRYQGIFAGHARRFIASEFTDVNLQEAQFTDVNLSKATFTDINFSGAKFSNLNLTNVEIDACDTTGMKFRGVLVSDLFAAYKNENNSPS